MGVLGVRSPERPRRGAAGPATIRPTVAMRWYQRERVVFLFMNSKSAAYPAVVVPVVTLAQADVMAEAGEIAELHVGLAR